MLIVLICQPGVPTLRRSASFIHDVSFNSRNHSVKVVGDQLCFTDEGVEPRKHKLAHRHSRMEECRHIQGLTSDADWVEPGSKLDVGMVVILPALTEIVKREGRKPVWAPVTCLSRAHPAVLEFEVEMSSLWLMKR